MSDYPWHRLAAATWEESRLAAWAGAARWPGGGILGAVRWGRAVDDPAEVASRMSEVSAARVTIRGPHLSAVVSAPWALWRALADQVLGDSGEAKLPRPPTRVERAFVALAIADALERSGVDATVELVAAPPAATGAVLCELAVAAPIAAIVTVAIARVDPAPRRSLGSLLDSRGTWLPDVICAFELARGRWRGSAGELGRLRRRDVVVVGPPVGGVWVAAGEIPVAFDLDRRAVIVSGPYRRRSVMCPPFPDDDGSERLGDDLSLALTIAVSDVPVSARQLLELTPGQVLATRRPIGTAVELRLEGRVVARGELVDVGGELGVRVVEIAGGEPSPVLSA